MSDLTRVSLKSPYLLLVGGETDTTYAKTAQGLVQWCPEKVMGQLRFEEDAVDLGVEDLTVAEAAARGCGSVVIGVAPVGGAVPDRWWAVLEDAAAAGLDVVSGLHLRLTDRPTLVEAAQSGGGRLVDVRVPPPGLPVGTGKRRPGRRILTVAADCAIGKKYTALALHRALEKAGADTRFRATGQTGIMIAGEGLPIDSVVADFIAGAAEVLSPAADPDHVDVIEGQGSVFHPGYSGVALGLLHGSQPDAFLVCHDPRRETVAGWPHYRLPPLAEVIETHERLANRTRPGSRCLGVSVNTASFPDAERHRLLEEITTATGLPCADPLRDGCGVFARRFLDEFAPG